ncbi:MAG: ECF transporter S component [Candidatus Hodarchaeota archaeon]
MQYINRPIINNTSKLAMTSILASLAVALRLFKHLIIGPIQIINLPGVMTVASGILMGAISGFIVGLFSFFVSDLILGFGPWTPITAGFMGLIGIAAGLLWFRRENISRLELFTISFILILVNDIFTSVGGYMILGLSFENALLTSLIGLFLPAGGGFFLAVGPITEGATAFLIAVLTPNLRRHSGEVNGRWEQ